MAKARIKSKSGISVEVEGTAAEISKVISEVEQKEQRQKERKSSGSASDYILLLREQGFFKKPRSLVEIKNKLAESGLIYPITSLSAIVLFQVRKRNLGRVKEDKIWKYVQR